MNIKLILILVSFLLNSKLVFGYFPPEEYDSSCAAAPSIYENNPQARSLNIDINKIAKELEDEIEDVTRFARVYVNRSSEEYEFCSFFGMCVPFQKENTESLELFKKDTKENAINVIRRLANVKIKLKRMIELILKNDESIKELVESKDFKKEYPDLILFPPNDLKHIFKSHKRFSYNRIRCTDDYCWLFYAVTCNNRFTCLEIVSGLCWCSICTCGIVPVSCLAAQAGAFVATLPWRINKIKSYKSYFKSDGLDLEQRILRYRWAVSFWKGFLNDYLQSGYEISTGERPPEVMSMEMN